MAGILSARRRAMMLGYSSSDYTPCEYIYYPSSPDFTNSINSGVTRTSEISVEICAELTGGTSAGAVFYGSWGASSNGLGYSRNGQWGYFLEWGSNSVELNAGYPSAEAHVMRNSKNIFSLDGTAIRAFGYAQWVSTAKVTVCSSLIGAGAYAKYYYCKIWDGDTLVRDFVPCYDANGIGLMYDNVTHTAFYGSQDDYSWA